MILLRALYQQPDDPTWRHGFTFLAPSLDAGQSVVRAPHVAGIVWKVEPARTAASDSYTVPFVHGWDWHRRQA